MPRSDRLRELRRAWRRRTERRGPRDVGYVAYLVALLVPLVAYPVLRAAALALAAPPVLAAFDSAEAPTVAAASGGLLVAASICTGGLYGPITIAPVRVLLLAGTDLPRSVSLLRPFLWRSGALAGGYGAVGLLIGGVRLSAGDASATSAFVFVLASVLVGFVGSVAWLAGQAAGRRAWWIGLPVGAASLCATAWGPAWLAPIGLLGGAWPSLSPSPWPVVGLAALGAVAGLAVRPLLDRLRGPQLLADALRWQAVGRRAMYGDVHGALGSLRARPRRGRRWRALVRGGALRRFLVADLVGACRTPGRFLIGLVFLAVAQAMVATSSATRFAGLVVGAAALLGYLAMGVFADGLRHAVLSAVGPPVFGVGRWRLLALRVSMPSVVLAASCGVASAAGLAVGAAVVHVAPAIIASLVWLGLRAWNTAKGDLPIWLLTPIASPMGDLSGVALCVWQLDAPLLSVVATVTVASLAGAHHTVAAVAVAVALLVALTVGLRRRIDAL